ncbi:MAG: hypothetical protein ACLFO1_06125 [Spirochaetaceae bacterium]
MGTRPSRSWGTEARPGRLPARRSPRLPVALRRLVLATPAAALLLYAGCAGNDPEPWRYTAFDAGDTHTYPRGWRDEWEVEPHAAFDLPGHTAGAAFLGDVRGSDAPEIIVASANRLEVFAMDGRHLGSYGYPVAHAVPGFLMDADSDDKLDLVAGSFEEANPTFFVINGRGKVIYRHAVSEGRRDYRSIEPVVHENGAVYLMTRENWVDSPRGFIRYSLEKHREVWEFLIPGDPLDLRPVGDDTDPPRFVVSYATRPTGGSRRFGIDHSRQFKGIDAATRIIEFEESGRISRAPVIWNGGVPLSGNARVFPLGENDRSDFLVIRDFLNYQGTDPDPPWVDFLIVRSGGGDADIARTVAFARYTLSTYRDFRLLQTSRGPLVVLLLQDADGFHLELRDGELELLRTLTFPGSAATTDGERTRAGRTAITTGAPAVDSPVRLGPVFSDPDALVEPLVTVLRDGGLYLYDTRLTGRRIASVDGARTVLPWLGPDGGRLVVLGERGEVLRVGAR